MRLLRVILAFISCSMSTSEFENYHKYCIVGAGPGGLQMGFFLHNASRDYIIFERSSIPGSFFLKYPRHRTLISINKRFTGSTNVEFNFRHDWNSLISSDESLLFTKYSDQMFPHADDMVRYLGDYTRKLGLNVQFNTTISDINKPNGSKIFSMKDQTNKKYHCTCVIVANGISVPIVPNITGVQYAEGYENVSVDPNDFKGQTVMIMGRGNSAYETALNIYGSTNLIHMIGRSRARLSWSTHYVGDLRAVNNALLDTYQLKSLDGMLEQNLYKKSIVKKGGKLYRVDNKYRSSRENRPSRIGYDRVIRCLGFKADFSLFHKDMGIDTIHPDLKYPPIYATYESVDIPLLYFAGTNTHSVDFRKSAGGFIHGFRYTVQATHRHLEWANHRVPWPSTVLPQTELLNIIMRRINEASGNYQMVSILGDVVIFGKDGQNIRYLEEFPLLTLHELTNMAGYEVESGVLVWRFEYGSNFSGPGEDVFRSSRAAGKTYQAAFSNFLHPVFYYYKSLPTEEEMIDLKEANLPQPDAIHHILEDFLTLWDSHHVHALPLRRFLEKIFSTNLQDYFDETCFMFALKNTYQPPACLEHYMKKNGLSGDIM